MLKKKKYCKNIQKDIQQDILDNWEEIAQKFVKVVPNDYKTMLEKIASFKQEGLTADEAAMKAFLSTSTKKVEKKPTLIQK